MVLHLGACEAAPIASRADRQCSGGPPRRRRTAAAPGLSGVRPSAQALAGEPLAPQEDHHAPRVQQRLALLEDVANASSIVLHPETPGYFLQIGVLMHLPRLAETLSQLRASGRAVAVAR